MIEELVFIIVGLLGLWIGADFLIRGAKNIAEHFGLSKFFIGLVFVSIGTSLPEIAVSIAGGLDRLAGLETSGIVIGNKVGSALVQISLLFGILAFIIPLHLKRKEIVKQGAFLLASILLVFILGSNGYLSRLDGLIVILAYAAYYIYLWRTTKIKRPGPTVGFKPVQNFALAFLGAILIWFASDMVVEKGVAFASALGVNQSLIGILIVGLGTGLPEFSVAITAVRKKVVEISIGDLIGSNICDLLLSLGAGTVISGFLVNHVILWFDLPVLFLISLLVIYFLYTGRRISKKEGSILIFLFILYTLVKIFIVG